MRDCNRQKIQTFVLSIAFWPGFVLDAPKTAPQIINHNTILLNFFSIMRQDDPLWKGYPFEKALQYYQDQQVYFYQVDI